MMTTKKIFSRTIGFVSACMMTLTMAAYVPAKADNAPTEEQTAKLINEIEIFVNQARKEAGLKPVYVVPYLNEVAAVRAEESSESFSHTRNGGTEGFETIIDTDIAPYGFAAENLACGFGDTETTFEQWRHSEKHWASIVNPTITHMGVGVYYDPEKPYEWYWQQTFIRSDVEFADQYLPSDTVVVPAGDGDVDGDASISVFDYTLITDYVRKQHKKYPVYFNEAQREAADCFRDGLITEADAKVVCRYLLGEYDSVVFEF